MSIRATLLISMMTSIAISLFVSTNVLARDGGVVKNHDAFVWAQRGAESARASQFQQARQCYERAAAIEPEASGIHFNLATVYSELGMHEEAVSELLKAKKLKVQIPSVSYNIACEYQALGKIDEAITWFKKYVVDNPNGELVSKAGSAIAALKFTAPSCRDVDVNAPDYYNAMVAEGKVRWTPTRMPIKIFIDAGQSYFGLPPYYPPIMYQSIVEWVQASRNKIGIVLVPHKDQADMVCEWTTDCTKFGSGGGGEDGVALLSSSRDPNDPNKNETLNSVHVYILIQDNQGKYFTPRYLRQVCLHEIGHGFGLHGHSANNRDAMFMSSLPEMPPVLTNRDRATICRLYEDYPEYSPTMPSAFQQASNR